MTNMFYPFLTVLCTTALNSEITCMTKREELLYMEFENSTAKIGNKKEKKIRQRGANSLHH